MRNDNIFMNFKAGSLLRSTLWGLIRRLEALRLFQEAISTAKHANLITSSAAYCGRSKNRRREEFTLVS